MKLLQILPISNLLARAALALSAALVLASCGGGGSVVTGVASPRALSAEVASRNAVNYAPFRTLECKVEIRPKVYVYVGQCAYDSNNILRALSNNQVAIPTGEPPTLEEPDSANFAAHIKEDLDLMVAGNFRLIRLFDSSDKVSKQILRIIRDNNLDIKVMLGVWIASGNDAFNKAEIARGVALAKQYSDIVVALSVGNETMVSWSFNPLSVSQMAAYIKSVRSQVTQPVTTDDNWAFFAQSGAKEKNPRAVLDVIDFVAMHTYPLAETIHPPATWVWEQFGEEAGPLRATAMMDASIAAARLQYGAVRAHLDSVGFPNMPIVIGETGWKAVASNGESNRAHPVNQKMYLERLNTWTSESRAGKGGPKSIFYFAAFDEQWKGSDDKWGLFNKDRQARYVVQALYPKAQGYTHEAGTYTEANAVYAPDVTNAVVTGNRFTVYADTVPAGASPAVATGANWFGWDAPATAFGGEEDSGVPVTGEPGDSPHGIVIKPQPVSWGWGIVVAPGDGTVTADLSAYESGKLNFSIMTTYPGPIEVGFLTGKGLTPSAYDVYMKISNNNADGYGYISDGNWHQVSVPISELKKNGAMAFRADGNYDPTKSYFDLTMVTNPFVIADRFEKTGNTQGAATNTKIYVDNIYWSK
jgi:exo-beta-1,3-glucanase (GH17 family)